MVLVLNDHSCYVMNFNVSSCVYLIPKVSKSNIYEENGKFLRITGLVQVVGDQSKCK